MSTSVLKYRMINCPFRSMPVFYQEMAIHQVCLFFFDIPVHVCRDAIKKCNPLCIYSVDYHSVKFDPVLFEDFLSRLQFYIRH